MKMLILLAALLAMPASAADKKTPGAKPDADSGAKKITELCSKDKTKPFGTLEPAVPMSPFDTSKPLDDDGEKQLRFKSCVTARAQGKPQEKDLCDLTLAKVLRFFLEESKQLVADLGKVCTKIDSIKTSCTDQSEFEKCSKEIYKDTAQDLAGVSDSLKKKSAKLAEIHDENIKVLNKERQSLITARTAAPTKAAVTKRSQEAVTGTTGDRKTQFDVCSREIAGKGLFCGHVVAATDSKVFSDAFKKQLESTASLSKDFNAKGTVAGGRGDNTKSDVTGGGPDLGDAMKVATLGMTAASLICGLTGKCSPKKDESTIQDQNPNAANPAATAAAAAPSELEKSSLGDAGKSTAATGAPEVPKVDGNSATAYKEGGSGFSMKPDEALSHFNGALGHSPASTGPIGGGGGGGGSGGSGGSDHGDPNAAHDPGKQGDTPATMGGGLPGGPGGGMGSGSGGFNLGDTHNPNSPDAALKNILNGDGLPTSTDPSLAGLDGLNPETKQGSDGLGADDPENLFFRVKGTHIRCLKRGCVGHGVNGHI